MAIKRKLYPIKYIRINSRIRVDQHKFIKKYARQHRVTEGEALRAIIDNFLMNV